MKTIIFWCRTHLTKLSDVSKNSSSREKLFLELRRSGATCYLGDAVGREPRIIRVDNLIGVTVGEQVRSVQTLPETVRLRTLLQLLVTVVLLPEIPLFILIFTLTLTVTLTWALTLTYIRILQYPLLKVNDTDVVVGERNVMVFHESLAQHGVRSQKELILSGRDQGLIDQRKFLFFRYVNSNSLVDAIAEPHYGEMYDVMVCRPLYHSCFVT